MGMTNDGLSYWQAETEGLELLEMTLGDLLDSRADEIPAQEAVVYSCYPEFGGALDIRWSYAEFRERVNAVARGLLALGLQKGEHIAVWAANLPEWVLLEFAAAKAGLVLVTVNPVYRAAELEYVLKQGDVVALFFMARVRDHDCLATVLSMITPGSKNGEVSSERLPMLRYVSLMGAPPAGLLEQEGWRPTLFREMVIGGATVSAEALRKRQVSVKPTEPTMIIYTSGTTGFPKGAMLTHSGVINNTMIAMRRSSTLVGPGDRYCLPLPFFHIAGAGIAIAVIAAKLTLHPLLAFDPLKTLQIIKQEGCTLIFAVPTMLIAMLQHPEFETYRPTTLKAVASGAAPVPVALMEQVKERMGSDVAIVFGQTEATGGITLTLPDDSFERKSETVGIPSPHVDVKIINPATGKVMPVGERGELCCKGFLAMTGYYKMPEKTAEAIDSEGWLHTGDLATMDAQGYVNIVGRLKEMVIRGGENIFPREIEELLISNPMIYCSYEKANYGETASECRSSRDALPAGQRPGGAREDDRSSGGFRRARRPKRFGKSLAIAWPGFAPLPIATTKTGRAGSATVVMAMKAGSFLLSAQLRAQLVAALEEPPPDGGLWTGRHVAQWILVHPGRNVHPQRGWEYLKRLGTSKRVLRPRHAKADAAAKVPFKKTSPSS